MPASLSRCRRSEPEPGDRIAPVSAFNAPTSLNPDNVAENSCAFAARGERATKIMQRRPAIEKRLIPPPWKNRLHVVKVGKIGHEASRSASRTSSSVDLYRNEPGDA